MCFHSYPGKLDWRVGWIQFLFSFLKFFLCIYIVFIKKKMLTLHTYNDTYIHTYITGLEGSDDDLSFFSLFFFPFLFLFLCNKTLWSLFTFLYFRFSTRVQGPFRIDIVTLFLFFSLCGVFCIM